MKKEKLITWDFGLKQYLLSQKIIQLEHILFVGEIFQPVNIG
jgi:hypothetical protein